MPGAPKRRASLDSLCSIGPALMVPAMVYLIVLYVHVMIALFPNY